LSQSLFSALADELLVVCVEPWHMQAVPKAQINKTDQPLPAAATPPH
jgi:hypothetical protein